MRSFHNTWMLLVLSAAIGAGSVHAQQTPDAPPPPTTADVDATVTVGVRAQLSVPEMNQQRTTIEAEVKNDYRHVLYLQAQARKDKDVIKLNCINDKLVRMKAQLNIFDGLVLTLNGAIERDSEDRHSLFGQVEVAATEIKKLRGEADLCAGTELITDGFTTLVDRPVFPDDPTTWDPAWDPVIADDIEPPGYASPYN